MGTLRFLLAIAVAMAHGGCVRQYCIYPADNAVQIFFVVSGFLITMILTEKYQGRLWLFYSNRALRIYVPYLSVFAVALVFALGATSYGSVPSYFRELHRAAPALDPLTWLYVGVGNIGIFDQELGPFLGFNGHLYFTGEYWTSPVYVTRLFLVTPAWTLGIELLFYLLAPFLVSRSIWLSIGLLTISSAVRMIAYRNGLDHDPWTYRFFPFELSLFLAGSISYRIWTHLRERLVLPPAAASLTVIAIAGLAAAHPWIGFSVEHRWIFYALVVGTLPALFMFSGRNAWDTALGDLSYPVYLIHLPLGGALATLFPAYVPLHLASYNVPATLFVAILFVRFVERPLDAARQRRVRRSRTPIWPPKKTLSNRPGVVPGFSSYASDGIVHPDI